MRTELKRIGKTQRHRYSGIFENYGFKYADRQKVHAKPTMVLKDIKLVTDDQEILVADHLWFNVTLGFKRLGILVKGEKLYFDGRVTHYEKGYYLDGISVDYKLERPTKILLPEPTLEQSSRTYFPDENWKMCQKIYALNRNYYIDKGISKPYGYYF